MYAYAMSHLSAVQLHRSSNSWERS